MSPIALRRPPPQAMLPPREKQKNPTAALASANERSTTAPVRPRFPAQAPERTRIPRPREIASLGFSSTCLLVPKARDLAPPASARRINRRSEEQLFSHHPRVKALIFSSAFHFASSIASREKIEMPAAPPASAILMFA